jgi:membrane protein YqaA with SNARE-associated domain
VGLAGLLLSGDYSTVLLIAVASLGNTLGAVVNWALGRGIDRFSDRRWFPVKPAQLERAARWYHRYGKWSLLLSWAPFVGDPLTVAAGVLREPFGAFLLLVALAKTGRYLAVAALALS